MVALLCADDVNKETGGKTENIAREARLATYRSYYASLGVPATSIMEYEYEIDPRYEAHFIHYS